MIARELVIGGGVAVAAVLGLVYAASAKAAPGASGSGSLSFVAGHRYEIDIDVPPSTLPSGSMPILAHVQEGFDDLAAGGFSVQGVGVNLAGTAAPGSGYTFYVIVDALKAATLSQADLLSGFPTGTTITATDNGLTPSTTSSSSSSTSSTTTSSSSSSSTSSASSLPQLTSVLGQPPPSAAAAAQWLTTVTLGADPQPVTVSYWPGDTIVLSLTAGASWASSGSTPGAPTSGDASYTFVAAAGLGDLVLAWMLNGHTFTTTLHFVQGRTWAAATTWGPLDTVRIGISSAGYTAMDAAVQSGSWATEVAALQAMATQIAAAVGTQPTTPAQGLYNLLTTGPFAALLGVIPSASGVLAPAPTLRTWVAASAVAGYAASSYPAAAGSLPSDWPSDPGSIMRAEFQSAVVAGRADASTLPFPVLAWVRTT